MTTTAGTQVQQTDVVANAQRGAIAGLVGGSVFGVQMAVGGMLPMVANMVGSENVVVGFVLHMLISAFIGATYGVAAARMPTSLTVHVGAGFVYGLVWWVLGALIIMPLALGMGEMVLQIGEAQWMSFVGHGIFGILMGAIFALAIHLER